MLQKLLTKSARAATVSILLPFIALVVLSKELLGLFGGAYQEGGTALIMLCVAQVVNIVSGSGGIALIMTGHERDAATAMGLAAILAVIMNIVLIPVWGINGAAAAAAMSMVAWNIIMVLLVRRRLGLDPTALGLFLNP
ncbi:MAG: polysaccharide biosynthesis C-terminal domain-containing protein [Nitrospirota bacterium]|nr:MAG: polysaccharide biosynthesis C-terminal domain-containing protein [Nitrospirota bacterium]